jgi:hypothetical protein
MLEDDHQLTASVGYIWEQMKRFLGLDEIGQDLRGGAVSGPV